MDNEQRQDEHTYGRSYPAEVTADDLPGLEMAALDEARKLFGPDMQLAVRRDYVVHQSGTSVVAELGWGTYHAQITVVEVIS